MTKNEPTKSKKNRVLFFDDDPPTIMGLAEHLKLHGWVVHFVSDIDKVFSELMQFQFDILILDIVSPMPRKESEQIKFSPSEIDDMDKGMLTGVVLAKKIWSMGEYEDIPVIFHSARSNPIPGDRMLQNSNCVFMRKPQSAKDVMAKLEELLNY